MSSRIAPPCHDCAGTGWIDDGRQIDVDQFEDCACSNCKGSGVEPPHKAGARYTGPVKPLHLYCGVQVFGDVLDALSKSRRLLMSASVQDGQRPLARARYMHYRQKATARCFGLTHAENLYRDSILAPAVWPLDRAA
jgi:hypothetical protein